MKNTKKYLSSGVALAITLLTTSSSNCSSRSDRVPPKYGESYYSVKEKREMRSAEPAHMSNIYFLSDEIEKLNKRISSLEQTMKTHKK